jgi:GcrA cell cycle regulator
MLWTDERIAQLKAMWEIGMSGGQIAAELGDLTRNAVIGKVHRLGLQNRVKATSYKPLPRKPNRDTTQHKVESRPIPRKQRRTLFQLTSTTCRWPIGDPGTKDFYFCGDVSKGGGSYCADHCVLAYQPRRSS